MVVAPSRGRWFVTGTDTDIGKSAVTACLAQAARAAGSVVAAKPVASGVQRGSAGEDAELLAASAGHRPRVRYTLEAPLSPHRAAALEGATVERAALRAFVDELDADCVLVEGVGGWCVPLCLAPPLWVEDLAVATRGAVLVVAPDRLGTLNHTVLTVRAVEASGLPVAGVVLNRGVGPADASRTSNADDLGALLGGPVVPFDAVDLSSERARAAAGAALWSALDVLWSRGLWGCGCR